MGKPTGFMEFRRQEVPHREVGQRVKDFFEIDMPLPADALLKQAARCMDCGVPFCHGTGCPLNNRVPEFNDFIYKGRWQEACENLHSTNNFPEITGRICPALCEASCTLSFNDQPVLIKHIELQIVERGWAEGWITPKVARVKTGYKVAVVGSGPAGLAVAQQLARAGHSVVLFEKDSRIGGLLRYGIPDFKLDKRILDRRLEQMAAEGVEFRTSVEIGEDMSPKYLRGHYDAIVLTMGAGQPRDLTVGGRELQNVHYALEFLIQQNKINAGDKLTGPQIDAKDKIVAVIGGGDTGSDCVGTSQRHGAKQIFQYEILPMPPESRPADTPWPMWPRVLRTSSSHEEGCNRRWCVLTKKLVGSNGRVEELHGIEVQWTPNGKGGYNMSEIPGSEFVQKVDLVLLAMGFTGVVQAGMVQKMGVKLDPRGNVSATNYMTSEEGIFVAGDATEGASLVVRAIASGRKCASAVDQWLRSKK